MSDIVIHLTARESEDLLKYLELSRKRLICQYSQGVLEFVKQLRKGIANDKIANT